jgi:HTH-type transcriptional regulator/antitoxin HipB
MHPVVSAKQIGATLAARRKSLKLSQAQLAAKLDLSQNRLSELEAYPETRNVAQLLRLLSALGLEISLGEPGARPAPPLPPGQPAAAAPAKYRRRR